LGALYESFLWGKNSLQNFCLETTRMLTHLEELEQI